MSRNGPIDSRGGGRRKAEGSESTSSGLRSDVRGPRGIRVSPSGFHSVDYRIQTSSCGRHYAYASVSEYETLLVPTPGVVGGARYVVLDSQSVALSKCGANVADFDLVIPPRSDVSLSGKVTVNGEPPSAMSSGLTIRIQAGPLTMVYRADASAASIPSDGIYSVNYEIATGSCGEHVAVAWLMQAARLRDSETVVFRSCGPLRHDWALEFQIVDPSKTRQ